MTWGHKLTFSVYMEGDFTRSYEALKGIDVVNGAFPNAHFVGCKVEPVEDEPKDQG